jgi:hypothetical protein
MQIHLVLPGLIWPAASAISPVSGIELPALARLLGLGQRHVRHFEPLDRHFGRLFGMTSEPLPLAALRRLGEADQIDAAGNWLCADPVNLSFAREHLLLHDFPNDELSADEAATLVDALNEVFADLGRFEACTPSRWYLNVPGPTRVTMYPLHDVVGRPIKHFLPEGEDARQWQRTMNEAQIVLHNHPLNQEREAAGRRPINSLWLWGAGALTEKLAPPMAAVQTDDPLVAGLARASGLHAMVPSLPAALNADTLVVLDGLLEPALNFDLDTWRTRLVALERDWFAPLAEALRSGRLRTLTITAPGDRGTLELSVRAGDRWKFWRKPHSLDALIKSMLPASALPDPTQSPSVPPGATQQQ